MKRLFVAAFIFCYQFTFAQTSKHVILISIDGFRPEMYLNSKWPTPNLQCLMKEGVYADHMISVFPAYTYPSHTAMLTGALPARSGITHNVKDDKGNWFWFTKDIKVPTLWQVLKQTGLTTSAVEWPVSVSDDITCNVPEIWSNKDPEDRITETRKYATKGLIEEIETNATGKLDSTSMRDEYMTLDENSGRIAAYIFKKYKPNLLCVHFAEVDGMEHEHGLDDDSVRLAVATADHAIGDIIEAVQRSGMKESTTIIVVGDHGFSNIHTVLRPNVLIKDLPVKFKSSGGSAFLYLLPVDTSLYIRTPFSDTVVMDVELPFNEEMAMLVKNKLNDLPKDQRKLFRIIDRKELDKMGGNSAALLALSAVPGVVFSGAVPSNAGPGTNIVQNNATGFMGTTKGGHHGYDPNIKEMYTGFIVVGAGINKGKVIKELCVTDIAPLIAKLLGVEFKCPDGRLVEGILR